MNESLSSPDESVTAQLKVRERSSFTGPLFFWEALRGARKANQYFPRLALPAVLLTLFLIAFAGKDVTLKQSAYFGENAFEWYITIQYLAVLFLTPIHVAGAIVEERQRGTLMLLLTTHLTPRDIILGKMLGSMVPILASMLAGLPILAMLQLFGGVDFIKVIWHTVLALLLMLMIAMYAIRSSTQYWSTGSAIFFTYVKAVGGLSLLYSLIILVFIFWLFTNSGMVLRIRYQAEWFMTCLIVCNLLLAYLLSYRRAIRAFRIQHRSKWIFSSEALGRENNRSGAKGNAEEVGNKLVRQNVETVLEGVPAEMESPLQEVSQEPNLRPWKVPAAYEKQPLVWKQCYFPDHTSVIATTWVAGMVIVLIFFASVMNQNESRVMTLADNNYWLIRMSLLCFMVLVIFRACKVLTEERGQKTLLMLLMLPMTHTEMVMEIAWGCIWRYRWMGLVCLLPLCEGIVIDSISFVLIIGTTLSQLVLLVMVSLFLSMVLQTALRARMVVITIFLALCFNGLTMQRVFGWYNCLLLAPFQYFPHPLIHTESGGQQLVLLLAYWLALWSAAYLVLLLIVHQLRRYVVNS